MIHPLWEPPGKIAMKTAPIFYGNCTDSHENSLAKIWKLHGIQWTPPGENMKTARNPMKTAWRKYENWTKHKRCTKTAPNTAPNIEEGTYPSLRVFGASSKTLPHRQNMKTAWRKRTESDENRLAKIWKPHGIQWTPPGKNMKTAPLGGFQILKTSWSPMNTA